MEIIIRNSNPKPIYEQIYDQIVQAVLSGELIEGESLPSIRNLAKDLRISVITTKRAYDELERDGFVETVAGKGSFVAGINHEMVREDHLRQLEQLIEKANDLAEKIGLSQEEFFNMILVLKNERNSQ